MSGEQKCACWIVGILATAICVFAGMAFAYNAAVWRTLKDGGYEQRVVVGSGCAIWVKKGEN